MNQPSRGEHRTFFKILSNDLQISQQKKSNIPSLSNSRAVNFTPSELKSSFTFNQKHFFQLLIVEKFLVVSYQKYKVTLHINLLYK